MPFFILGKEPPVPNAEGARQAPELVWTFWRRENLLPLLGIEMQLFVQLSWYSDYTKSLY
jgi:hypothetical protein